MTLYQRLFGTEQTDNEPVIRFGRYTDAYRSQLQEGEFDQAVKEFEDEQYMNAFLHFFRYLLDEKEKNIEIIEENGELKFELYQGSKKITGFANENKFYAVAKIAKAKELRSSYMRRLLEENSELKFSRFALTPEDEIAIVFDTFTVDGSPYKLYTALKELATHADKQDDLLIDEFEQLEHTNLMVRRELPEAEKEIKYNYIIQEIKAVFKETDEGKLNADQYPLGILYLLLGLSYKLDYLTKPEGFMMDAMERIHRMAFAKDEKNIAQKNLALRKEYQQLLERPKEKFFSEMYEVRATFGITSPVDHDKIATIISQELPNMKWYLDHGYPAIAMAFPVYIVGRCLFHFAAPLPDKDLFHLFFKIVESDYFGDLGFKRYVLNGSPNVKAIQKAIKNIAEKHKKSYPRLNPDLKKLVFDSMPHFAESYLWMMKDLDLTKVD